MSFVIRGEPRLLIVDADYVQAFAA